MYDRQTGRHDWITEPFDRSVSSFVWSPDSRYVYFGAQDEMWRSIYRIPVTGGEVEQLTERTYDGAFD
ncbi:MAG: hypothetical protein GWN85_31060, partial [Gemmatimonadetes bacterium]|nr:hypothetical protein [Gemmatimonadota bacterium]NIR38821.1 hypothetical protein [Actinomycetota bacterium]NIS33461.1 hypothetical protein [Actinomycetota bacterium]NIU68352.1 hypothetical protein [Actinomycetota bacterium]NIW30175.1 hypothetical protein [Actinomycetota bacterium]